MTEERERFRQLQNEMEQLRQSLERGPSGSSNRSFSSVTSSALGNLSRLQSSFSGPRFNPMSSASRGQSSSRRSSNKSQGRRYDIYLVLLDYIANEPREALLTEHHTIGNAQLTLFSTFDEKRCEREIMSTIKMFKI